MDGKKYPFKKEKGELDFDRKTSKLHAKAKRIIKELLPVTFLSEEVSIQINRAKHLFLDIYLPTLRVAVEVHGEQHVQYNSHFFKNRKGFVAAQKRDVMKSKWCELNNIDLIELFYNESEDEWRRKIREVIG